MECAVSAFIQSVMHLSIERAECSMQKGKQKREHARNFVRGTVSVREESVRQGA